MIFDGLIRVVAAVGLGAATLCARAQAPQPARAPAKTQAPGQTKAPSTAPVQTQALAPAKTQSSVQTHAPMLAPSAPRGATQATTRAAQRGAEEMLRQMLKPASEQPRPLQPIPDAGAAIRPDRSTLDTVAPGATPRPLLPEGSYIIDRLARLTRHAPGVLSELSFVSDGQTMSDPPLIALPSSELAAVERLVDSSHTDPLLWISGVITQYNGRNYILLQRWSQVNESANPLK